MNKLSDARKLAGLMVNIGTLISQENGGNDNRHGSAPGSHIGNALEVKEAIEILNGGHKNTRFTRFRLSSVLI